MNSAFQSCQYEIPLDLQACVDHVFDKGSAPFEGDTMISSCKNDINDPTLEHLPSSRHLNSACAILQQRHGDWVGPELGVTTYRICWKINIHKRVDKRSENISREAYYSVITHLCFPLSLLLCDSSFIVPQNTLDTKPDMRAIQFFKCYSLQSTENSIHPHMTL